MEAIFSLEQETSAVRRLNESGVLENPPRKLAEALGICRELYQRTGGAFDVSVQPLWELYEAHYRRHPEDADGPPDEALRQTREKVGFDAVEWDARSARLLRPGMALTLNGMAQGFATDRIAELLLRAGVKRALINLGEYRAIGTAPEEVAWNIAIRGAGGQILAELPLADRALATSAGSGWTFDSQGRFHHLFHPRGGSARPARETLVVAAPAAAWADGLATAGLVMKPADFARVIAELDWPAEFRRYEGG